jgi:hypothetical protein
VLVCVCVHVGARVRMCVYGLSVRQSMSVFCVRLATMVINLDGDVTHTHTHAPCPHTRTFTRSLPPIGIEDVKWFYDAVEKDEASFVVSLEDLWNQVCVLGVCICVGRRRVCVRVGGYVLGRDESVCMWVNERTVCPDGVSPSLTTPPARLHNCLPPPSPPLLTLSLSSPSPSSLFPQAHINACSPSLPYQVLDMTHPINKMGISPTDLWKCGLGAGVLGLIINHNDMLLHRTTAEWGRGDFPL